MGPTTAADRVSLIHRAWRLLPANARVRFIRRAGAWLAPTIEPGTPMASAGIAVGGEFSNASGMGESARIIQQALSVIDVPNWSIDTGSPWHLGKIRPAASVLEAIPRHAPLMLHVNAPMLPLVMCRLPRTMLQQRRVVGFWNWELPVVSRDWIIGARFVHEVWVASRFTAAALEPVLPGRVRVVPYPLALVPPRPSALDRAAFGLPDGAVVILVSFNLASSMARKNPMAAIAAFRAAFGGRPDRILLMKVGHPHHFPTEFAKLAAAATGPNIRLETWNLSTADNHALIAAADIVLSLHRSEGFGLVPAEAMLLGKPVIATAWSGNIDFMDADSAALVGYRLVPARDPRGTYDIADAVWAEPDVAEAVAHLQRLADDAAARRELGARARLAAHARLGSEPLAAAVRALGIHHPGESAMDKVTA
jgi:glycosyltransferase involved in cell wall biosynthesis